jgi:hypothetical protein
VKESAPTTTYQSSSKGMQNQTQKTSKWTEERKEAIKMAPKRVQLSTKGLLPRIS